MGRVLGLIACSGLVATGLWLTNLAHSTKTISAGIEPSRSTAQPSAQDLLKRGKELYLRGRYTEALDVFEAAAAAAVLSEEKREADHYLARTRTKLRERQEAAVTVRGQSPESDFFPAGQDALRTRVEGLMQKAYVAQRQGDRAKALESALQARQIAGEAGLQFGPGEDSPARLIARLQGRAVPSGVEHASGVQENESRISLAGGTAEPEQLDPFADINRDENSESARAPLPSLKQQALELVAQAREDVNSGRFDEARAKALKADELGVAWGLFEDRPQHVLSEIERHTKTITIASGRKPAPLPAADENPFADSAAQSAPAAETASSTQPVENPAKQQAVALLKQARADIQAGHYESARAKARQAQDLNVAYRLFEDRPEVVLQELESLQATTQIAQAGGAASSEAVSQAAGNAVPTAPSPQNQRTASGPNAETEKAQQLLVQARAALAAGQMDIARQKAVAASQLKATFGLFDDRPDLVLDEVERMASRGVPSPSVQDLAQNDSRPSASSPAAPAQSGHREEAAALLRQARTLIKEGRLDEAGQLALAAQKLNATYGVVEDRPDLVLADISRLNRNSGDIATNSRPAKVDPAVQTADIASEEEESNPFAPVAGTKPTSPQNAGDLRSVSPIPTSADPLAEATAYADPGAEEQVSVIHPSGVSAQDLYNQGLLALRNGSREEAYQAFLEAHQSGQKLDHYRAQRLQDFLRELAPRNKSGIQLASNQVVDSDLASGEDREPSRLDMVEQQDALKFDRLRTEALNAIFKAERLREKQPDQAIEILDQAMAKVEASDLNPQVLTSVSSSLQRTRTSIEEARKTREPMIAQERQNQEVTDRVARDVQTQIRVEQEFAKLVDEFNTLMAERRYAEAEIVAKQAKQLNPELSEGETMFWKARFARRIAVNGDIDLAKEDARVESMIDVDRAMINPVITDSIAYPKHWKDIATRRKSYERGAKIPTPEEEKIERTLDKPISLHFRNAPLEQVISHIASVADVNVAIDRLGLEDEGLSTDTPVTIDVDGIKLKSALNLMLEQFRLGYTIKDEVLKITSQMRQQGDLHIRTYSVADLVVPIPNFVPSGSTAMNAAGLGIANSGGTGGQFSVPATGGMQNPGGQGFAQMQPGMGAFGNPLNTLGSPDVQLAGGGSSVDFGTLTDLILTTVSPDSWDEVGGPASVRSHEATLSLVVRQTQRVHEEIADLLEQLRRLQDLQVTIEVRFVTVADRFFERIGVDFDFDINDTIGGPNVLNSGAALPPFGSVITPAQGFAGLPQQGQQGQNIRGQQQQGQQGQQQGVTGFFEPQPQRDLIERDRWPGGTTVVGMNGPEQFSPDLDVPFRQGSFEVGVPDFGGFNPNAGIQVGFAILSDIEAFFFIQAAQGDERTNLLFAPKVTLFNGQTATVISAVQRPFVTSLIPVVGFFSVGFQPQITVLNEGTTLQVSAVISADRRYVRLTVVPSFTNITDVFTFSFVSGIGGGGGGQLGGGGGGQGGGGGFGQGGGGGQFGGGGGGFGFGGIGGQQGGGQQGGGQAGQGGQQGQQGQQGGGGGGAITIQQPVFEVVSVTTTVSVPDGGTVLLGGIKRLREGRNMAGVPILNKIPYISRLFKNTGIGRETESLMMMVTPRIIIQEEEEELLGVDLSN